MKSSETTPMTWLEKVLNQINNYIRQLTDFWQEDIDVAEKVLDKNWPEIRELFRLKLAFFPRVDQQEKNEFDEDEFSTMLRSLRKTYNDIRELFETMYTESESCQRYKQDILESSTNYSLPKYCHRCQ
jgi:hypothetical protein